MPNRGRKKVIWAGITSDFCVDLPTKNMAPEGHDVRLLMDASDNDSPIVLQPAIANRRSSGLKSFFQKATHRFMHRLMIGSLQLLGVF